MCTRRITAARSLMEIRMKTFISAFTLSLGLLFSPHVLADAKAACEKSAADKKLAGAAKDGHIKKCASLGGFSAQSGPLQARGWRVGRSLNVHGSQDGSGLRVDSDIGHGLPTQRAAPP